MSTLCRTRAYDFAKRGLDIIGASFALILTVPIQGAIAVTVARKLGRPVLFRQQRPGRHDKTFTLIKFRSMKDIDEVHGLITDEQRLTSFGKRLRSTSMDELPTLLNVVRGDMSMVGPRPLLVSYLDRYTPEQARRHDVRPGVTGLAQVSGRNAIPWDKKLALDVQYVDHRSLWLDASILCKTITSVLRRKDISSHGHVTTPEFQGTAGEIRGNN